MPAFNYAGTTFSGNIELYEWSYKGKSYYFIDTEIKLKNGSYLWPYKKYFEEQHITVTKHPVSMDGAEIIAFLSR